MEIEETAVVERARLAADRQGCQRERATDEPDLPWANDRAFHAEIVEGEGDRRFDGRWRHLVAAVKRVERCLDTGTRTPAAWPRPKPWGDEETRWKDQNLREQLRVGELYCQDKGSPVRKPADRQSRPGIIPPAVSIRRGPAVRACERRTRPLP